MHREISAGKVGMSDASFPLSSQGAGRDAL